MKWGLQLFWKQMHFFNILFAMYSIVIISIGVLMRLRLSDISNFLDANCSTTHKMSIACGSILLVTSLYGLYVAVKKTVWMIFIYSVMTVVLFALSMALAVVSYQFEHNVEAVLRQSFLKAVLKYNISAADTENVDIIQESFRCCGVFGPGEYSSIQSVPKSCCVHSNGTCEKLNNENQVYQASCVDQMTSSVDTLGITISIISVAIAVNMIVAIVLSGGLIRAIRKKESRV